MAWTRIGSRLTGAATAIAAAIMTATVPASVTAADPGVPPAPAVDPGAATPTVADPLVRSGAPSATPISADGSRLVDFRVVGDRNLRLGVYSAAMDQVIELDVQRPADTSVPRPTLYLLAGAGGGEDSATWQARTSALEFLAAHPVNVVQPIGGAWSYYTDWRARDPVLGVNKWKTFLTEELPPVIDGALGTDGLNALAGLSMSGTSVLQLPIAAPGSYRAVAAYSGCAQISDPLGHQLVQTVVAAGGGDVVNMYGPPDDPMWVANDPYVNAEGLRGVELFLSTGSGLPGRWDQLNGPRAQPGVDGLVNQVVLGGLLEAATDLCTRNMRDRLTGLGIEATYVFDPTGTHSWGYWEDALKQSWPVLARGLELAE
ncbi:esterase family protein [Nocardia higoensis]|uniref:Esterase family protein n=1 Tax=Nocardia higoensis TaxID=228599 RepID=A0ABS0DCE6_9NOCA|nr:alpha/beta hydrolase family protein [Nocardia higoensis]MBF6354569.1 esterase family protein [Nocardia higoensis]